MAMAQDRSDHQEQRLIGDIEFDHRSDQGLLEHAWGRWDELRSTYRFLRSRRDGWDVWVAMSYDDVRETAQRWDLFSSITLDVNSRELVPEDRRIIPAEIDPPAHAGYRQMLLDYFAPARITQLEPAIRSRAVELIDGFAGDGHCDLIKQFSKQYPTHVFMEIMGLPTEDADQLLAWSDTSLHAGSSEEEQRRADEAREHVRAYLQALADTRRQDPRDDVMTRLVTGTLNGRKLEDHEVIGYSLTLYFGGLDTVAMELGHMFRFLATHPDHRRQIVENPAIIPGAVEEMLRYFSIVSTGRVVTRDEDFHGCPMKKGDRLLFSTPAAGHDPNEFEDPHRVDFLRSSNRHLAFGAGPHRCIGSHLARAELVIAMEEWHKRIPDYGLAEAGPTTYHGGVVLGADSLGLAW